jgi:hypothetical protein
MKKVFQILSMAVIVLTAASCGGNVQITYSDEPIAAVKVNGKWGYIDTKGNEAVPCKYDDVKEFSEGLAVVTLGDKWMFVDKTGKVIFKLGKKEKYDYVYSFSEGLAWVSSYDGFIDKTGKVVISCKDKDGNRKYRDTRSFHDGRAAVKRNEKWGFIDTTGTEVIPCQYLEVTDFSGGRTKAITASDSRFQNNITEILDIDGAIAEEKKRHQTTLYVRETSSVATGIRYVVVGKDGKKTPDKYINTRDFSDGMVAVAERQEDVLTSLWGFVNEDARETVPCKYFRVGDFNDGYAAAQLPAKYKKDKGFYTKIVTGGGKWGLIDKTGKTIVPFEYDSDYRDSQISYVDEDNFHLMHFADDMAMVIRDGKAGYVDKSGKEVIPCKYNFATDFSDGFAKVKNNKDKYGIIDKTGREIIPFGSEGEFRQFTNGFCAISRNGKWGFVDTTGKEVISCKYDVVYDFK